MLTCEVSSCFIHIHSRLGSSHRQFFHISRIAFLKDLSLHFDKDSPCGLLYILDRTLPTCQARKCFSLATVWIPSDYIIAWSPPVYDWLHHASTFLSDAASSWYSKLCISKVKGTKVVARAYTLSPQTSLNAKCILTLNQFVKETNRQMPYANVFSKVHNFFALIAIRCNFQHQCSAWTEYPKVCRQTSFPWLWHRS